MSIDVIALTSSRRARRGVSIGGVALALLFVALLLGVGTRSTAAAMPDLGPSAVALPADMTLAQLLDEVAGIDAVGPDPATVDFVTGSTFAGGFDADEYQSLQLDADGSKWIFDANAKAFTAVAIGTFVNDTNANATFTVLVHAVAHEAAGGTTPPPSLAIIVTANNTTAGQDLALNDLVPVLRGTKPNVVARAGELDGAQIGLSSFQGDTPIDTATIPAGATDFVQRALGVDSLGTELGNPDAGAPVVPGAVASRVHLHAEVNPRRALIADMSLIGAQDGIAGELSGVVANSFPEFALLRTNAASALQLGAFRLTMSLPATVPSWTPDGWLALDNTAADPPSWTVDIGYDTVQKRLEVAGQGPAWDIVLPVVFPDGTTFSPNFALADPLEANVDSKQMVVGGTIGKWVPEGRPDIEVSVSANFSKRGADKVADFYVTATLPNADPTKTAETDKVSANGDLFVTKGKGDWSVTLALGFDKAFSVDRITDIFAGSDPGASSNVPPQLLSVGVEDLRVVLSIASGGTDDAVQPPKKKPPVGSVGLTGRITISPFTKPGTPVPTALQGGVSIMGFSSFGGGESPTVMLGVAPSFRRIGGADPAQQPVYLSDVLGATVDPQSDLKVYDPDRPDTGFGLVYSSAQANIGGDASDRTEVPVNVAQWLMPLWGYNGSDEALEASTAFGAVGCGDCSFLPDFAPRLRFVVPGQALTAAGSLVMPNPVGTRTDWAASCTPDPDTDACRSALGFLGQLSLDSRVSISGSFPLGIGSGEPPALGLELRLGMRNDLPIERPTWLNDGRFALSLKVEPSTSTVRLGVSATLQLALKQGLSAADAADLFPGDAQAIADHTLQPWQPGETCARGGVPLEERSGDGGFEPGKSYCHDLLNATVEASLSISPTAVSIALKGDLVKTRLVNPNGPKDLTNTTLDTVDGWRPAGMDKFEVSQITVEIMFNTGPSGLSATFNAAASVGILTTPKITAAAAISLEFTPATVVLKGFRVNIGQLTLGNVIEIYEWISGATVNADELPGVALRNVALSIGFDDVKSVCIEKGFFLSGDLYVTDQQLTTVPPNFVCDAVSTSATYGKLQPSPEAPCDDADIAAGCVAGIRLLVNDRGVFGDAFIAEFSAGPVHLYDPTPDTDPTTPDAPGRAISVTFKVTNAGVKIDIFGGAALGGSKSPPANVCTSGFYCDSWAKGELTARIRANKVSGVDVKVFGRAQSGIPGLSFQIIVAGTAKLDGATQLAKLFTKGELPQGSLRLHVELANRAAAPDLDFAAAAQAEVDAKFGAVLDSLQQSATIIEKLQTNPSEAMTLLEQYVQDANDKNITVDKALTDLIVIVDDILTSAEEAGQDANLDWLLRGFYFPSIPPGVPNLGDVFLGVSPPRCDGANYGYGPDGTLYPTANYYPYNYCMLYRTGYTDGLCDLLTVPDADCTLSKVAEVAIVRPLLELVLAGVEVSSEIVQFAQDATDTVLSGELLRIDCASFDLGIDAGGTITDPRVAANVQLGLFLTFFGQPVGVSFEWFVDTEQGPEQFAENLDNLVTSLLQALEGNTPSTCWTDAEVKAFTEVDIDDPTADGVAPPPPPAVLTSAVLTDAATPLTPNLTREAAAATLTIDFDRPVTATRTLEIAWGDGTTSTVTIPAGEASVQAPHVWTDDDPTGSQSDLVSVVITDVSVSPAKRITTPVTVLNVAPSNVTVTPTATAIHENQAVGLDVTFTDPGSADTHVVRVEWQSGTVGTYAVPAGARSLAIAPFTYLQNPLAEVANIKVTVVDDDRGSGQTTSAVAVTNVAPEITGIMLVGTEPVLESVARDYLVQWDDPGTLDAHAIHVKWNWDGQADTAAAPIVWDEIWLVRDGKLYDALRNDPLTAPTPVRTLGTGVIRSLTLQHTYVDDVTPGTQVDDVRPLVRIVDVPDADRDTEDTVVPVNDVAPVVSRNVATQTRQYSDVLGDVTIAATDILGDTLSASTTFTLNGGTPQPGLPTGVRLSAKSCSPDAAAGRQRCTWTIGGNAGVAAGTYGINVTIGEEDTLSTTVSTTLIVLAEDSVVRFDTANPLDVRVSAPGGTSPTFQLRVHVEETEPDVPTEWAAPGDITKAAVEVTLVPVGPGSSYKVTCPATGSTGSGYSGVLTVTCTWTGVPVNTYYVDTRVVGGYYVGGDEDVVTISDPSLGFTTGGGWFYWPGTTDRVNFGYTVKYTKKFTNVQGNLVVIRHLADGTSYRVKSNSITGLSIGKGIDFTWATFTGKNTYSEPGWATALGNYAFTVYVEDRGEPGTGDRLWLEVKDKDRVIVSAMSVGRKATDGAVRLLGGNVVVPH